jgi:hypothetical protein
MGPRSHEYEQYANWYEHQQRRIAELETENRELRRQLEDLRRGIGIAVLIHGRPIPLTPLQPSAHLSDGPASSSGAHGAPPLYPEESWLTGPQRAAQPAPQRAPAAPHAAGR